MSLTISESGGGDFTPLPEGTHIARCVRVIDLGLQPGSPQFPDPKNKVLFVWEVPDECVNIDGTDRPGLLMARYTSSLHKKSKLRADLESWRGRAFTDAELKGFSLRAVLDATCMITVVHSSDGKFANVRAIAKMPKGVPSPARMSDLLYYEIEDGHNAVYHQLSEKLRETIDIGADDSAPVPAPAPVAPRAQAAAPQHDIHREERVARPGGQLRESVAQQSSALPVADMPEYFDDDVPF